MRITDLWFNRKKPTVSFELFPARSEKAAEKLEHTIDDLAELRPDFVSVTFGAGGSTREGSRQLLEKLKNEKTLKVIAYFAGYGLGPEDVSSVMNNYKDLGIETILIVRGDPPEQGDFTPHPQSIEHASDLIQFIDKQYDFCLGCAGYPEGHIDAINMEKDLEYLKLKIENGAEFVITNYFYDNKLFFNFVDRCKEAEIHVPILPGVMPVYSIKMMNVLANLCGATITEELKDGLNELPSGDTKALEAFGIEFALKQCRDLLQQGVPGIHIYTMDRSQAPVEIVKKLRKEGLL